MPHSDATEAALIPNLEVIPVQSLAELYDHLSEQCELIAQPQTTPVDIPVNLQNDFRDINKQEHVKRAMKSATSKHNIFMEWTTNGGIQPYFGLFSIFKC